MGWFSVQTLILSAVCLFGLFSIYVMITHEIHVTITFGPSGMTDSKQHEMLHNKKLTSLLTSSSSKVIPSTSSTSSSTMKEPEKIETKQKSQFSEIVRDQFSTSGCPKCKIGEEKFGSPRGIAGCGCRKTKKQEFDKKIDPEQIVNSIIGVETPVKSTTPHVNEQKEEAYKLIAPINKKEDTIKTTSNVKTLVKKSNDHPVKPLDLVDDLMLDENGGKVKNIASSSSTTTTSSSSTSSQQQSQPQSSSSSSKFQPDKSKRIETKGKLMCEGKNIDSEIIYWKDVQGDSDYESPITPHHHEHNDKYITFEYDNGGWNNVRMGLECVVVLSHAMGRTLVIPPQQHLYLLGATHKDKDDKKAHDEMGFTDFFDVNLLKSNIGIKMIDMPTFLEKEGVTGHLKHILPPQNKTNVWGGKLWRYLDKVADYTPEFHGRYMAFPAHADDYQISVSNNNDETINRMKKFGGGRRPIFYDETLQSKKHIYVPGDDAHRILQHHYAFAFFADPIQQSFYKRFIRDKFRYKDVIQCSGHKILQRVRKKSIELGNNGTFYAIHARRGDFQFKEVKLSAQEIVENLKDKNGNPIIPKGAMVYLSTDDPDGECKGCRVQAKPCEKYTPGSKPPGCPEDPSWNAFKEIGGWKVYFLRDFLQKSESKKYTGTINPNHYGMIESIVCSKAEIFAGTMYSTFTGYIHRLRGFHGLGESTYYHHKRFVHAARKKQSVGHGFAREWRAGWTDDEGNLITNSNSS